VTTPVPVGYAGFVTRAVGLVIDAILIAVVAVLTGAAINLVASLFGHHGGINLIEAIFGAAAWGVWSGVYFVMFWTLTGQTPAGRLLGFRVTRPDGGRIGIARAVRRFGFMILSGLALGAGFLPILVDDRRRGLHDLMAGTVVRWDDRSPEAEAHHDPEPLAPS